jgi:hypothetical protein
MRDLINNNIIARFRWLEAIKSRSISVTKKQAQAISSMKEFCHLEVPDHFTNIAYNTLKSRTTSGKIQELNVPGANQWDYVKLLRQEAAETIPKSEAPSPKFNNPNLPDLYSTALLEAHLCSLAYLEIYRFLEDLVFRTTDENSDLSELISNQLKICSAKFSNIVSPGLMTSEGRNFELIIGGKAP